MNELRNFGILTFKFQTTIICIVKYLYYYYGVTRRQIIFSLGSRASYYGRFGGFIFFLMTPLRFNHYSFQMMTSYYIIICNRGLENNMLLKYQLIEKLKV